MPNYNSNYPNSVEQKLNLNTIEVLLQISQYCGSNTLKYPQTVKVLSNFPYTVEENSHYIYHNAVEVILPLSHNCGSNTPTIQILSS